MGIAMQSYKIKPPAYLLIAVILTVVLHFAFPIMTVIPAPWTLLGIIPVVVGIVINFNADQIFHKADTAVCPFESSSTLVTYGPYRFTRNPMYLGFVLVLIGVSIVMGSLTPYLMAIAFAVLMDRKFIQMEEQKLAVQFGVEWKTYKSHTRRWL